MRGETRRDGWRDIYCTDMSSNLIISWYLLDYTRRDELKLYMQNSSTNT